MHSVVSHPTVALAPHDQGHKLEQNDLIPRKTSREMANIELERSDDQWKIE